MNQWKRELDKTAGSFQEEKGRLMQGVLQKKAKQRSKRTLLPSLVASIVVAVMGIFVYDQFWVDERAQQAAFVSIQFATPDKPVYFDEKAFQFYQATYYEGFKGEVPGADDLEQSLRDGAFELMISQQMLELKAVERGFVLTETAYITAERKAKELVKTFPSEGIASYAKTLGMTVEAFTESVLVPTITKNSMIQEFLNTEASQVTSYELIDFQHTYREKIEALAVEMHVNFVPREQWSGTFEGVVAAKDGNALLVVYDILPEEVAQIISMEALLALYPEHYWFEFVEPISIDIGSYVRVEFDISSLGDDRRAKGVYIERIQE